MVSFIWQTSTADTHPHTPHYTRCGIVGGVACWRRPKYVVPLLCCEMWWRKTRFARRCHHGCSRAAMLMVQQLLEWHGIMIGVAHRRNFYGMWVCWAHSVCRNWRFYIFFCRKRGKHRTTQRIRPFVNKLCWRFHDPECVSNASRKYSMWFFRMRPSTLKLGPF